MIFLLYKYLKKRYKDSKINSYVFFMILLLSSLLIFDIKTYFLSLLFTTISIVDLLEHKIPNEINLMFLLYSIGLYFFDNGFILKGFSNNSFMGAAFLIILAIISLSTSSLGFADIRLMASIFIAKSSIFFLNFLFYLSILLFIASIFLLLKSKNRKIEMPMAPLIHVAYFLTLFY